jgi:hypothetical protein
MNIKPEFCLGNLELSETLPDMYTWDELASIQWTFFWRVPKPWELIKLYEDEPLSHCDGYYWADSPIAYDSDRAWCVHFEDGFVKYVDRSRKHRVRLVRTIIKPIGPLLSPTGKIYHTGRDLFLQSLVAWSASVKCRRER